LTDISNVSVCARARVYTSPGSSQVHKGMTKDINPLMLIDPVDVHPAAERFIHILSHCRECANCGMFLNCLRDAQIFIASSHTSEK
jgi:hypothetical protein